MVLVYDPATLETKPHPVKVGLNNNIQAQITDGLAEGDLVVQTGAAPVASGTGGGGGRNFGGGALGFGCAGGGRPPG